MDYTAGVLTEHEHAMLGEAGVSAPTGWTLLKDTPVTRLVPKASGTLGLVFLPQPVWNDGRLDSTQMEATQKAIRDLKIKSGASLVIAISPWGQRAEQDFLSAGGPLPDILFGSGPGSGMAGQIMDQGKTLWVRPYSKGKALNRIEILSIPNKTEGRGWISGENIKYSLAILDNGIRPDPAATNLLKAAEGNVNSAHVDDAKALLERTLQFQADASTSKSVSPQ